MHRRSVGTAFRALTLALLASVATTALADVANPYDKFRNASYSNKGLASEQDEVRLGSEVHRQVLAKFRMVQDPELAGYVERVGQRVASVSKRSNLQFQFFVVDDQSVNAFSIPGGFVYVNTGLLDMVQSEDELAAVLAHEIGHVVARHGLRNYKKAQRTSLWTGILGTAAVIASGGSMGGQAANAAVKLFGAGILTRNSREFEREADYLGLYDLAAAGYQPSGMVRVFERLAKNPSSSKSSIGGIFADHPDSKERIRNTQIEIEQHFGGSTALATGSSRPRRMGQATSRTMGQATSNGEFVAMKRALADYSSGRRRQRDNRGYDPQGRRSDPQDGGYDANDEPIQNNRPILRRRTQQQP